MPTLFAILRAAEEFEVPPRKAVIQRLSFLMPLIKKLECEVAVLKKRAAAASLKKKRICFEVMIKLYEHDLRPLQAEAKALLDYINGKIDMKENDGPISPEMITRAKAVPMAQLLGQKPIGQARMVSCPFHTDKKPSASVKNNFLICFAGCLPRDGRKGWDTISLLMELEGKTFPKAVFALQ